VQIPKPTDADRDRFLGLVPDAPGVEVKPMWHMFMGLFGADVGVKLPEGLRAELLRQPGSGPFGPEERPMGGYVTLPAGWSARQAKRWIDAALADVAALPPKQPKPRTKKRAAP
jgi:hypothetical protein